MSFPQTASRTGAPSTFRTLPASQGHLAGWPRGQIAHGVDIAAWAHPRPTVPTTMKQSGPV